MERAEDAARIDAGAELATVISARSARRVSAVSFEGDGAGLLAPFPAAVRVGRHHAYGEVQHRVVGELARQHHG